jgi:uncharacterized protein YbcI
MSDTQPDLERPLNGLTAVSNALVALHKEQFGRGPTSARTNFAGPDSLVCIFENALLPAERAMVEMGEAQRVRESRMWFQVATSEKFVETVEQIVGRTVRAFASATDPEKGVVMEIFVFEPRDDGAGAGADGHRPIDAR